MSSMIHQKYFRDKKSINKCEREEERVCLTRYDYISHAPSSSALTQRKDEVKQIIGAAQHHLASAIGFRV